MGLVIILFRDLDQEQFIIRSVAILVVTCVTVAILFVPKFYTVYYGVRLGTYAFAVNSITHAQYTCCSFRMTRNRWPVVSVNQPAMS